MKITVVSKDETQLGEIARLLRERSSADEVSVLAGSFERIAAMADQGAPDVLLLAQATLDGVELERVERLGNLFPDSALVLMCQQQGPEFLLAAMRIGVREVLPAPASTQSLYPAMQRIADKRDSRVHADGKVLAFVSCKGGSGATFLATNLGYALAAQEHKRVALFDLNLAFGDASLFVSEQRPLATLADVARQIHRLDPSFLHASMINIAPNFSLLAAPDNPADAGDVKPEHIDTLLRLARRHFDFILIDIGRSLDAISVRALDQADTIFPIVQTTLPYIRDGKRLLSVFRSLEYSRDKIQIIVNRFEKNSQIQLSDFEKAFDAVPFMAIPNHYEAAAASVNQGIPLLKLARTSPLSKAIQDMAARLAGPQQARNENSWLGRLFQRPTRSKEAFQ
ncbi:MAG: AAA family ATPase [Pseudomonadota bacterium]